MFDKRDYPLKRITESVMKEMLISGWRDFLKIEFRTTISSHLDKEHTR